MSKVKIQIKSLWGSILYEDEKDDYTLAGALRDANLYGANLHGADLRGADLRDANLYGANLYGADLYGADLYGADLRSADLHGADLRGADLRGADLYGADLRGADLYGADLHGADLHGADLHGADLHGADLYGADLYGADLRGADLYGANLHGANLHGAKDADYAIALTRILPEGDIIGYKKCANGKIVKLRIPMDAKRSHAFGRKCRAEYAEVIEITKGTRQLKTAVSQHDNTFKYKVGATVRPTQDFDDNWMDECSTGIHFFITKIEAERYS